MGMEATSVSYDDDNASVGTVLTIQSFDSISVASASSIFLSEPPGLPHVDSFIRNPALRFENLKPARNIKQVRNHSTKRRKRVSKKDYIKLFNYIDACGDFNGIITLHELEMGIAKYRYAKIHHHEEDAARKLFLELEGAMIRSKLTPQTWFDKYHSHKPHHNSHHHMTRHAKHHQETEAKLLHHHEVAIQEKNEAYYAKARMTHADALRGCDEVRASRHLPPWQDHEHQIMLRFMDPNADGKLSMQEVKHTFGRLRMPAEARFIMELAGDILDVVDNFMRKRRMRVRDLYEFLVKQHDAVDAAGHESSREISKVDLEEGVHAIVRLERAEKLRDEEYKRERLESEAVQVDQGIMGAVPFADDVSVGSLDSTSTRNRMGGRQGRSLRMWKGMHERDMRVKLPAIEKQRQTLQNAVAEARALSDSRFNFKAASARREQAAHASRRALRWGRVGKVPVTAGGNINVRSAGQKSNFNKFYDQQAVHYESTFSHIDQVLNKALGKLNKH